MAEDTQKTIRCSFCGRREDQVPRLITGPHACICSDCVAACCDLLEMRDQEQHEGAAGPPSNPAQPY